MIPVSIDSGLVHLWAHPIIRGLSQHDCYYLTRPEPAKCTTKREEFGPESITDIGKSYLNFPLYVPLKPLPGALSWHLGAIAPQLPTRS